MDRLESRADQLIREMLLSEQHTPVAVPQNASARHKLSHPTLRNVAAILTRAGFYHSSSDQLHESTTDHAFVRAGSTVVVTHTLNPETLLWTISTSRGSRMGSGIDALRKGVAALGRRRPVTV